MICIATFFVVWFSDPGFLPKKQKPLKDLLALESKEKSVCPDCEIWRPIRSRHCDTCKRCVMVFDHHCRRKPQLIQKLLHDSQNDSCILKGFQKISMDKQLCGSQKPQVLLCFHSLHRLHDTSHSRRQHHQYFSTQSFTRLSSIFKWLVLALNERQTWSSFPVFKILPLSNDFDFEIKISVILTFTLITFLFLVPLVYSS